MKSITKIICLLFLFLLTATSANASYVADESAKTLNLTSKNLKTDRLLVKRMVLNRILKQYESPLIEDVDSFLNTCIKYDLDCYLLPSITGLESYFGKFTHPNSNNPFGWGGGYIMFDSWESSISTVGKGLRENYINKGADSVEKIASIYAESKTWAPRVKYFMNVFEKEEDKFNTLFTENQVKL